MKKANIKGWIKHFMNFIRRATIFLLTVNRQSKDRSMIRLDLVAGIRAYQLSWDYEAPLQVLLFF